MSHESQEGLRAQESIDIKLAIRQIHDVTGGWLVSDFIYEQARHLITIEDGYDSIRISWAEDDIGKEERYDVFPSGQVLVTLTGIPESMHLRTGVETVRLAENISEITLKDSKQILRLAEYLQRVKKEGSLPVGCDSVHDYLD